MTSDMQGAAATRRSFIHFLGGAAAAGGSLGLLSGCGDGVVGADNVPAPTASSTVPVSVPSPYTVTDTDRLNFALQVHYLVASYLQISLDGSALPATLIGGSGTLGQVTGGRLVRFTDAKLLAIVREATTATVARLAYLRRLLGNAVTARPAISLATGAGTAFQAIAEPPRSTPPTSFYDPFASENDFLLGAVSLCAVLTSSLNELAWQMAINVRTSFSPLAVGTAATDSAFRNILFTRAAAEPSQSSNGRVSLFSRAKTMASARNPFDGPGNRDQNIGSRTDPNIDVRDDTNKVAVRRSPEKVLGVLYTSALSVSSGGFYPAGLNGTIRVSGANS